MPIAQAHTMPATRPTTSEPSGDTVPQDGVAATRPAMAPEAAPKLVAACRG